jgi:hypothetical protein
MRIVTTMIPMSRITIVSQGCFTEERNENTSSQCGMGGHVVPRSLCGIDNQTKACSDRLRNAHSGAFRLCFFWFICLRQQSVRARAPPKSEG